MEKGFAPGNTWAGSYNSGNPGNEKGVGQQYLFNTVADVVRIWTILSNPLTYDGAGDVATNIPSTATTYEAGELYKNVTTDEQGNAVVEYKDKEGKTVLKKVQVSAIAADYSGLAGFLCTYHIYDDLGQLRFVVPPKAVEAIKGDWNFTPAIINELCFRYEYDYRQRMIAKKVPGAGWVYMVYDMRDRLVFSQDINQCAGGQWLATLFDDLNRPVMTGMISYSGNRDDLQTYVNGLAGGSSTIAVNGNSASGIAPDAVYNSRETGKDHYQGTNTISFESGFESEPTADFTAEIVAGNGTGFSDNVGVYNSPLPPSSNFIALTITYYDNYNWTNKSYNTANNGQLDAGNNLHAEAVPATASGATKSMVTGTRVRVIENPANLAAGTFQANVNFYDEKGRLIQIQSENDKGGTDISTSRYDFSGKVLSTYLAHDNPAATGIKITTSMEYDPAGRLLGTWKTINDESAKKTLIAKNEYDELGQLKTKSVGRKKDINGNYTSDPLEILDYTYNIRGWLKGINPYYANKVTGVETDRWFGMELSYDWGFGNNQYNGNIAGTKWRSKGDGVQRAYGFSYDKVNR